MSIDFNSFLLAFNYRIDKVLMNFFIHSEKNVDLNFTVLMMTWVLFVLNELFGTGGFFCDELMI